MCVIFLYANSNPAPGGYKLIVASNRDEFYARETLGAAKWANAEHVYGGIDLEPGREGGTWLAVGGDSHVFKLGALLNLTGEPKHKNAVAHNNIMHNNHHLHHHNNNVNTTTSLPTTTTNPLLLGRGMIVSDFVRSAPHSSIDDYNRELLDDCTKYSAFNFISIEIGASSTPARIMHSSNAPVDHAHYVERQCYGFGNSLPSTPFEKVRHGQQRFEQLVAEFNDKPANDASRQKLVQHCFELLQCKEKFWPDAELQRRAPNWGAEMSALNVIIPHAGYGSRTHSVILIDADDKLHFHEQTMADVEPTGRWIETQIEKQYFRD